MSIVTKTGDKGTTALMYGRRVLKCHPRMEACGAVDELNAALGLARMAASDSFVNERLLPVQQDLVVLMGELAVAAEDLPRYVKDGYTRVIPAMTSRVENWVRELESTTVLPTDWATPGATLPAAALDVARTVCRRAERRVSELQRDGQLDNLEVLVFLNRLSDFLWLLARRAESSQGPAK